MTKKLQELRSLIEALSAEQQKELFQPLLQNHLVHPLEAQWNISADFVLEAIARSQDITKRGVRGIIAELCFDNYIIKPIAQKGWIPQTIVGDQPYDSHLKNGNREIKIQVKNQRLKKGVPLKAGEQSAKKFAGYADWWIAECQKTRTGTDAEGAATRPYRFGEFDILAVCLHPSTNDWTKFMFTPGAKLFPRPNDAGLIEIMQPVPPNKQGSWTDSLEECISWI